MTYIYVLLHDVLLMVQAARVSVFFLSTVSVCTCLCVCVSACECACICVYLCLPVGVCVHVCVRESACVFCGCVCVRVGTHSQAPLVSAGEQKNKESISMPPPPLAPSASTTLHSP